MWRCFKDVFPLCHFCTKTVVRWHCGCYLLLSLHEFHHVPTESDVVHQDKDNASVKEVSHMVFDPETPCRSSLEGDSLDLILFALGAQS